jgi:hypothetical protein
MTASRIESSDILALRREIYAKPSVSRTDLTRLLEVGRAVDVGGSPEFVDLLAEVATDLLVRQSDPPNYIARADADWLIACLGRNDLSFAELKMLAEILHYAVSAPLELVTYAVHQIEKKIVGGQPARVTHEDLELLRTAVYAGAEGSSLHVDRDSAEVLFRIAHATAGADNDREFDEFFAKAVGNYLMGIAFRWTPSASEARRSEKWLEEKPAGVEGFLSAMLLRGDQSGDEDMLESADEVEERLRLANEADAREMAIASEIDPAETDWLLAHLTRDGALTSAEKKLLFFLKEEAPMMPTSLLAIIEKQAA